MNVHRRPKTGQAAAFTALLALAGAASAYFALTQQPDQQIASLDIVTFAAAFFVSRLLALQLPQGDEVRIGLVAGLAGLGMLNVPSLLLAAAAGGLLEVLVRALQDSSGGVIERFLDVVRSVAILAILTPWSLKLGPLVAEASSGEGIVWWTVAAGLSYVLLDLLTLNVQQNLQTGSPLHRHVTGLVRLLLLVYLVNVAMAAVALRLRPPTSWDWTLWVALLLTLILQNSFNLYLRVRKAYVATIRVLARAAELDRPRDAGHAQRVADLAVAVGRRLGLSSHTLEQLDYAALLHDIGRIGHHEDEQGSHIARGAEIVATIPFLAEVAPLIAGPQDGDREERRTAAAVLRCCSRYDRLRIQSDARGALTEVHAEFGQSFPQVTKMLEAVVRDERAQAGVSLW